VVTLLVVGRFSGFCSGVVLPCWGGSIDKYGVMVSMICCRLASRWVLAQVIIAKYRVCCAANPSRLAAICWRLVANCMLPTPSMWIFLGFVAMLEVVIGQQWCIGIAGCSYRACIVGCTVVAMDPVLCLLLVSSGRYWDGCCGYCCHC